MPVVFELMQNYPNLFNSETVIRYTVQAASYISLKVYDVPGREVTSLVNEFKSAGEYKETLNPASLPSGTYINKLSADKFVFVKK